MKEYYKKENLEKIVKESFSLSEVLRKIGLADKGSNFATLSKYINLYDIDTTHFTGQTWNKGLKNVDKTARVKLKDILKEDTNFKCDTLKKRLLAEGILEYKCGNPSCGISEWQGKEITLELHHINGNHYDNRIENLILLCPNCHSQTESYRKRYLIRGIKNDKPKKIYNTYTTICANPNCKKEFQTNSKHKKYCCRECYNAVLKLNAEVKTNNKKYGLELEEVISDCINGQNIIKKDTIFRVSNVADVFYDVKFLGRDKNSNKIYFELIFIYNVR